MRRKKFYKNGNSADQVRTEPADLANTILKMACKRAMIAMTLNVTAASDIFTQDIEDLPEELRPQEQAQQHNPPPTDPELTKKWVDQAVAADTPDALTEVWKAGVKEIQGLKDMQAYDTFKAAVGVRGASLKAASDAKPEPEPALPTDDFGGPAGDDVEFEEIAE